MNFIIAKRYKNYVTLGAFNYKDMFMSRDKVLTVDIELYVKAHRAIPEGQCYLILVDRQKIKVGVEAMTGREILILANKNPPERFQLNQRLRGGKVLKVGYDQNISFLTGDAEKFMTIPLDQTEGGV